MAFIKKATRRIRNQYFIEYTIVGFMFSMIGCLMFLLVSLGITIPYANEKGIGIILVGMIICEIYTILKAPKYHEVTLRIDQTGLEERLSTALMLMNNEDSLSKLQRQDTLVHIQNYDLKKHFPYHCSIKKIGINLLLMVACIGVCMIPTQAKQEENELRLFQKEKQELTEQIEKQVEKLEEAEELSELTKEELANLLQKSKQEIPKSQDKNEVKKSMERLAKKLDNLAKENKKSKEQEAIHQINKTLTEPFQKKAQQEAQSDLETLSEALSKNEWTKDLAESLKQENDSAEQLEEALKELQEQIQEMSDAEKQALANTLSQLAPNLNSEQLASQLSQASSSLANNGIPNTQNLQATLKNLKQMAMSNTNNMSQSASGYQNSNNGGSQQGSNSNSGNGSGQGNGSGNSNTSGNGNNTGGGQGASGQGKGNGQGGGYNTGSQHGNEKDSIGNKADQIPETNPGYDANLSGKVDGSNSMEQGEIAYGINIAGQKVDYHSVVGDYTEEALENIEQEAVPEHMKDAIKDYFEAINQ